VDFHVGCVCTVWAGGDAYNPRVSKSHLVNGQVRRCLCAATNASGSPCASAILRLSTARPLCWPHRFAFISAAIRSRILMCALLLNQIAFLVFGSCPRNASTSLRVVCSKATFDPQSKPKTLMQQTWRDYKHPSRCLRRRSNLCLCRHTTSCHHGHREENQRVDPMQRADRRGSMASKGQSDLDDQ